MADIAVASFLLIKSSHVHILCKYYFLTSILLGKARAKLLPSLLTFFFYFCFFMFLFCFFFLCWIVCFGVKSKIFNISSRPLSATFVSYFSRWGRQITQAFTLCPLICGIVYCLRLLLQLASFFAVCVSFNLLGWQNFFLILTRLQGYHQLW